MIFAKFWLILVKFDAMSLNKLARFKQIGNWAHVFQANSGGSLREHWQNYLPKGQRLILELACGKGEYVVALGAKYPDCNFLGLDIKGDRLFVGAKRSLELNLKNVGFIRGFVQDLAKYFQAGDISEIWITFPDPYLSSTKFQKRLTHPNFLHIYAELMQGKGLVHLKTDEPKLLDFTRRVLNLYQIPIVKELSYSPQEIGLDSDERIYIPTYYERQNISQSQKTYYIAFCPKPTDFCQNLTKQQLREILCTEL